MTERARLAKLRSLFVIAQGTVFALDAQWEVRLDITPDEYEPFATLSAFDEGGDEVAQARVAPNFRLSTTSATAWIVGGFARPGGKEAFDY